MKKAISLLILLFMGCNNSSTDSEKTAKEENKEMIDSMKLNEGPSVMPSLSKADADFLVEAASGEMMEVELGKLAQAKSQREQVRAFGSMMVRDHEAGGEKLRDLAGSKNITLPAATSIDDHKLMKEKDDFDRAYITLMVDDHKKDIREFQKMAKNGSDSEIKAFAAETLPMLYKHLDSAQNLLKRMGPGRIPVSAPPYQ
ncbi:DUF4142 domain-containing protein [Chitinophaga sp. SYP-B3965]|uniref:DUF4142 domain-containing protein n=1 Tax=Chitinophaga sp. SYP-B3965 TaxID=2663120 RepID=UPI001299F0E2|nr:DUF4142 domain-containing protein [Chitinophaga sp. SYP-B3965]MRG47446.1 DUF4142 domain-containing protein [Chitinophaga sp. SYP-B3965]